MQKTPYKPLGHVDLPTGKYAVFPMNDIFLNYTFENEKNWEALRQIVNIFTKDFIEKYPGSTARPITGDIKVRTQYKQLVTGDPKKALSQDIHILENCKDATYTEFQIKAATKPIIDVRSVKYYGLGLSQSSGLANQLWLLAEDVESLLHGFPMTYYSLKPKFELIFFHNSMNLSKYGKTLHISPKIFGTTFYSQP